MLIKPTLYYLMINYKAAILNIEQTKNTTVEQVSGFQQRPKNLEN